MPRSPSDAARKPFVRDAVALERRILAVIDDRHAQHAGVLERPPHQQRRRHRPSVVGERHATGGLLRGELGELFAARAHRHGANRIDARKAGLGGLAQDQLGDAGMIVDRIRVRHARDGREASGNGADAYPVATVSLCSCPGSRRCTWMSIRPGTTSQPGFTLTTSAPSAGSDLADLRDATVLDAGRRTPRHDCSRGRSRARL